MYVIHDSTPKKKQTRYNIPMAFRSGAQSRNLWVTAFRSLRIK